MKKAALLYMSIPENSNAPSDKVPELTLAFWVIRYCRDDLGRNRRRRPLYDAEPGYALTAQVLFGILIAVVWAQIASKRFDPFLYWTVIVATTTVGTTMADFADLSLGVGYVGGSLI